MGTFGTIFNEQKVVPGRTQYYEPLVELNETQFFVGKKCSSFENSARKIGT